MENVKKKEITLEDLAKKLHEVELMCCFLMGMLMLSLFVLAM